MGIAEVQASQTKKENRLRPIFCPKGLSIRFGNSIRMLSHIVTGGIGKIAGRQIKVGAWTTFLCHNLSLKKCMIHIFFQTSLPVITAHLASY
uniref:Uncharacterized protein n=1 Tax=Arundo donax TaxID=35708 RepID=A0A0A9DN01_ARUDO